jgi:Protein of unknown function (DUF3300)
MSLKTRILFAAFLAAAVPPPSAMAQEATDQTQSAETGDSQAVADAGEDDDSGLLTQTELENLVAPVALYPDTLLLQILVGATYPLEVVKADRLLADNEDTDQDVFEDLVAQQDWDPSVAVLATAFPTVIGDMTDHLDWTETMGNAMLLQSDDVMNAIQTMRAQAINAGTLVDNEAQTVVQDDTGATVITPTDPQVVYVPQYDYRTVYQPGYQTGLTAGNIAAATAITFGTAILIDEIFDDDDDWGHYWGCRNCAGWGGRPIYRDPDIDFDVDGNVNIGNKIDFGDRGDIDLGDRGDLNLGDRGDLNLGDRLPGDGDGRWRPENVDRDQIKQAVHDRAKVRPLGGNEDARDELRRNLANRTGTADISRPGQLDREGGAAAIRDRVNNSSANRPNINRPNVDRPNANRPNVNRPNVDRPTVNRPSTNRPTVNRPSTNRPTVNRPAANRPSTRPATRDRTPTVKDRSRPKVSTSGGNRARPHVSKPSTNRKHAARPSTRKSSAMRSHGSGNKARAASRRGKSSNRSAKRRR